MFSRPSLAVSVKGWSETNIGVAIIRELLSYGKDDTQGNYNPHLSPKIAPADKAPVGPMPVTPGKGGVNSYCT